MYCHYYVYSQPAKQKNWQDSVKHKLTYLHLHMLDIVIVPEQLSNFKGVIYHT